MISRTELNDRVQEWGLRENVVEKDYVIGWVLWGIGTDERLSASWAFKGGTCLKKCYIETYRFSEDLDFTVFPGGPLVPEEVLPILTNVLGRVYNESGIEFSGRELAARLRPDGSSSEVRIYYRGPRQTPGVASIKLDLTGAEAVARPTVLRDISHRYPDELPAPGSVRCYAFEELFAEKIRAMGERSRPRDLYDIVNLFRRRDVLPHADLIRSVLIEKCRTKGIQVPTYESLESSPYRAEIETEWENMLAHQLLALPPFSDFWQELPNLFAWLNGLLIPEELLPLSPDVLEGEEWSPSPTAWVSGQGVPLETVRFAAANHLCVELGYGGRTRIIEPYSLRRTSEGNLLLYAVKAESQELRSYRVDRIRSLKVTNNPFKPRYTIEFASTGPLSAPPKTRQTSYGTMRQTRQSGMTYVIECLYCGKKFKRSRLDTRLNAHRMRGMDLKCPGRTGYLVDSHH